MNAALLFILLFLAGYLCGFGHRSLRSYVRRRRFRRGWARYYKRAY